MKIYKPVEVLYGLKGSPVSPCTLSFEAYSTAVVPGYFGRKKNILLKLNPHEEDTWQPRGGHAVFFSWRAFALRTFRVSLIIAI